MEKLKIGVIGAGGIANSIHLPVLSRFENVIITAVADLRPERAKNTAEKFGIPSAFTSHCDLLENCDVDAVFILTEPDMLFRAAYDSLCSGRHVFMEKPMGITLYQADTLKRAAQENKRILHVGYNRRYIPLITKAVELVSEIGKITQVEGRFYKNSSPAFYSGCASAFTCDVVHVTDLVRHIAGGKPIKAVTLETSSSADGLADSWHSIIRFDSGVTGVIRSHYATGGRVHEFEIHTKGASAFINLGFGVQGCSARILYSGGGKQSLSAKGLDGTSVIDLDGIEIAGSGRYEDYYGYRDEDRIFVEKLLSGATVDPERLNEDFATAELVETLLNAKI